MRLVIFQGTKEEFEAIRSLAEGDTVQPPTTAPEKAPAPGDHDGEEDNTESRAPTYEEAVAILRFRGGPSNGQRELLRVLFDEQAPVRSSTIRRETNWSQARFRGIRANFPRRAKGAVGDDGIKWLTREWIAEEGENQYSLPNTVRKALSDELGW